MRETAYNMLRAVKHHYTGGASALSLTSQLEPARSPLPVPLPFSPRFLDTRHSLSLAQRCSTAAQHYLQTAHCNPNKMADARLGSLLRQLEQRERLCYTLRSSS